MTCCVPFILKSHAPFFYHCCVVAQETATKPTYREEIEKDWRLILHDDTVHTIQQVCDIVAQVTATT